MAHLGIGFYWTDSEAHMYTCLYVCIEMCVCVYIVYAV